MAIPTDSTVRDLVIERFGRTAVLDRYGIDYCCGGQRTVEEACRVARADVATVLADVERFDAACDEVPPDWAHLGTIELIAHIESTHHVFVRESIARIEPLLAKVVAAHGEVHPELLEVEIIFSELAADMWPHLMKEEQVLFPMVQELADAKAVPAFHCGSIANPIAMMLAEHDMVGEHLRELRDITDDYRVPGDGCMSYEALYSALEEFEADTHLHIHKENNVLFPAVLAQEEEVAGAS